MQTIQQCIIRSGLRLPSEFYYRNKTGEVMVEPIKAIGDNENILSLNDAIACKENLVEYLNTVDECIDLYGNEFVFRHFELDFSVYDFETGRKLLDFPYHRSFYKLHEMLKSWMDEANNGKFFFRYNYTALDVYRRNIYICFSKYQLIAPTSENSAELPNNLATEELPPPLETVEFSDGWKGIPIITFRTSTRTFLNAFWRELFRAENFCRQVSKQCGVYENIWTYRRFVPQNIDELILSQNQMSFFFEVEDLFDLSVEGKYFTPSSKAVMVVGQMKKGVLHSGDEIICLNSCYEEEFRCTVESIEQPSVRNITEISFEAASKNGDNRFAIKIDNKKTQDFDYVFYICIK